MDKFVYLAVLVAVVVLGSASFAAAASPIRVLVPKAAKVVTGIPATIGKVGDGVSNWLWRNKGTVATGTVLTTFAMKPEPFLEATTKVASGHGGFGILIGLAALVGLIVLYEIGGRTRTIARIVTVALLIGLVLFCCNAARADDFSTMLEPTCIAWPIGWKFRGDRLLDIVLIAVMVLFPFS